MGENIILLWAHLSGSPLFLAMVALLFAVPIAIPREWSTLPLWIRGAILIVLLLVVAPIVALLYRCLAELAQRRGRSE